MKQKVSWSATRKRKHARTNPIRYDPNILFWTGPFLEKTAVSNCSFHRTL